MASTAPLRLMIYDRTCTGIAGRGLSEIWWAGALLYGGLDRLDAVKGVGDWNEGLDWLASVGEARPIAEIQYWGHGNWGCARVGKESLDGRSLVKGHAHRTRLDRVRERLAPDALWWFRTCDTFGSARGHDFAQRFSDTLGCDAAGHTHIIGPWQSGLHRLRPGSEPHWPADEGLSEGTAVAPVRSSWSWPNRPNTITCMHSRVPTGW